MLIQLFAGSSRAVYLCISSDGCVVGFDSGPLFCTNCDHKHESDETDHEHDVAASGNNCCDHDHDCEVDEDESESKVALGNGDCDCEHHLISSDDARSAPRSVNADDFEAMAFAFVVTSPIEFVRLSALGHSNTHYTPPPDIPDTTAVLSTVVIRS